MMLLISFIINYFCKSCLKLKYNHLNNLLNAIIMILFVFNINYNLSFEDSQEFGMFKSKRVISLLLVLLSAFSCAMAMDEDQLKIEDYNEDSGRQQGMKFSQDQNGQRQMQYFSQRRTACLVLSRYYTNQFSEDINGIVVDLSPEDQNKFINKLYATAVQKCQPVITQMQVMQFFTSTNQNLDPSGMFNIFEGYNFHEVTLNLDSMTKNQQAIIQFIKRFDSQMQIRKEEQQAHKMTDQKDQGVQVFFFSLKNLPSQLKYLYIAIVLLLSVGVVWWGFSQIDRKPQKNQNKRRKKQ